MTEIPGGFNPERVSNVVNLSKDIKTAGFIGDTSPESAEKAKEFLKKSFGTEYKDVDHMIETSQNAGLSKEKNEKAKKDLDELGAAFLLAGGGKVEELACSGELNQNVSSTLHGIDSIVNSNLFVKNENDEVGKLIVYKLREVEAFNIKAKIAPNAFESKRPAVVQEKIDALFDKYTEVQEDSEEAMKLGVVIGHLDSSIQGEKTAPIRIENTQSQTKNEQKNKNTDRYERKWLTESDPRELEKIARTNLNRIESREELSNRYRGLDTQPTSILDDISERLEGDLIIEAQKDKKIATTKGDTKTVLEINKKLEDYELLRKEIQARLTIFDISKLMSDVSFGISDRGGVRDAINQAAGMNRILNREVMGFCFEESEKVGLNIAKAWDLIQEANFNYAGFLQKIKDSGMADNYRGDNFLKLKDGFSLVPGQDMGLFMDNSLDPERAGIVDKYIISQLGDNGKKSYQLANELANATGETSSFNFGFIKGHGLCEVIYFKDFRDDDASKGKKVGPISNRGIKSLTHGWVRYFSGQNDLSGRMEKIKSEKIIENLDHVKGKEDSVMYFGKIVPSYVASVKNALMDVDPDMKKILSISYLQEIGPSFDKVDPPYKIMKTSNGWERAPDNYSGPTEKSRGGPESMKAFYVLGLLELFATKENIGMDMSTMTKFREFFVDTKLSETAKPFISESQWKWALEQKIANDGKGNNLSFTQAMKMNRVAKFKEDFWTYLLNGGKKGR